MLFEDVSAVPLEEALQPLRPSAGQKVAMLLTYPRSEEGTRSLMLDGFIAHRDSSNRTNVL